MTTDKPTLSINGSDCCGSLEFTMNLDNLEPGPKTDKLVAEAIGYDSASIVNKTDGTTACIHAESQGGGFEEFKPSTDLNDAFWAAEQVGRRIDLMSMPLAESPRYYQASIYSTGVRDGHQDGTPAMAICKAILGLKDK